MKPMRFIIVVLLVLFLTEPALAEEKILSFTEFYSNGKHDTVTDGQSIDVNSILVIKVNRCALLEKARKFNKEAQTQSFIQDLKKLQIVLAGAQQALMNIKQAVSVWSISGKKDDLDKVVNAQTEVTNRFNDIYNLTENGANPRLRQLINQALTSGLGLEAQYMAILGAVRTEIQLRQENLKELLRKEGIYVQVGGWVATPQGQFELHLPGFDNIPEQPYNELEGVHLAFSKSELQANAKLAGMINEGASSEAIAKELFLNIINGFVLKVNKMKQEIGDISQKIQLPNGGQGFSEVQTAISGVNESIKRFQAEIDLLKSKYERPQAVSAENFLMESKKDIEEIFALVQSIIANLEYAMITINQAWSELQKVLQAEALTIISQILQEIKDYKATLYNSQKVFLNILGGVFSINQTVVEARDFSNKVLKLALDDVPDETRLQLTTSGRKGAGDSILLRVVMGQTDGLARTEEDNFFVLQRIVSYITTVPGLIMASVPNSNPLSFQAASAYNILLKGGNRDWAFWNTILTPGIGINVAALDFNRADYAPELGLGLAVSLFRDILTLGSGYNVYTGQGYSFIGINLPLTTFGLPMAMNNSL